jgi:hypothetical protein
MSVEGVIDFFQIVRQKVRRLDENTPLLKIIHHQRLKTDLKTHICRCMEDRPSRPVFSRELFVAITE